MTHALRRYLSVLCILFVFQPSAVLAYRKPQAAATDVLLIIGGEVEKPQQLTAADLAKLPRRSVKATDPDGKEFTYEGVLLIDVLKLAGLRFGETLRGKRLATYLLVEATDGYQAIFALPELDPAFTDRVVLLADRRDGAPLPDSVAPLQIIIPGEKRHARYVRQVKSLIIRRA